MVIENILWFMYIAAAVCFVLGLHFMNSPKTARRGNFVSIAGMSLAIITSIWKISIDSVSYNSNSAIIIVLVLGVAFGSGAGYGLAKKVKMTQMPQLVSLFNMVGGGAAAIIAVNDLLIIPDISLTEFIISAIGIIIGGVTFSGSLIAAAKLHGVISSKVIDIPARIQILAGLLLLTVISLCLYGLNIPIIIAIIISICSLSLGVLLSLPIGGADMPVVISILNSLTGLAVATAGFTISNPIMIIAGAIVGSAGAILSILMSKAMNRPLLGILKGGFGQKVGESAALKQEVLYKLTTPDDLALKLAYADSVIIIPGFGLAAAGANSELSSLDKQLEERGINVKYAIHPVAGRMPGHMNILLAEANIDYEKMLELDAANSALEGADIALVIGANDVTNPAARKPGSAISGMPILNVDYAKEIIVIKRGQGSGFAGIDNELYELDKTAMLFGDAKDMLSQTVDSLNSL